MPSIYPGALEAIDRVLSRAGDADDVLRGVLAMLHRQVGFERAAIAFLDEGRLTVGPEVGEPSRDEESFAVAFQGKRVAELRVSPPPAGDRRAFVERVALLISPHCLVGWDTGGEPWDP